MKIWVVAKGILKELRRDEKPSLLLSIYISVYVSSSLTNPKEILWRRLVFRHEDFSFRFIVGADIWVMPL